MLITTHKIKIYEIIKLSWNPSGWLITMTQQKFRSIKESNNKNYKRVEILNCFSTLRS